MGNVLTADVCIQGTRTLLWNCFGPEAIPLEKQERTGVAGNDPEEWRSGVLMTRDRQLYLLPSQLFSCLRGGAFYVKKGRGSIQSAVAATLQVPDERILVDRFVPQEPLPTDAEELVYLDVRSVVNPNSKSRNVRYRVAAGPGWKAAFRLEWDKTVVSRGEMETALGDAAKLVGLGDGRKIGFGRFQILTFEVGDAQAATA